MRLYLLHTPGKDRAQFPKRDMNTLPLLVCGAEGAHT